jgi:DNA repair protein RadC
VDSAHIHLHTIFKTAIEHGAAALVSVYNHPSGDPESSKSDRQLTRDLVFAGNVTQINVLDHIIIGENKYYSFAASSLIKRYRNDFLNLRMRQIIRSK